MKNQVIVAYYQTSEGISPFEKWLVSLKDPIGQVAVAARLARMSAGHWGDFKPLGANLYELRISTGPGYRIYFTEQGKTLVIILAAGDKRSQRRDIQNARKYLETL